ncbi:unnamed protein product [Leuciscus chuanchicus]
MTQQALSLRSKSQVSISIPKRQIDYLSAMETVYEGSHPSLQSTDLRVKPLKSNDLHKGEKPKAEGLIRPWKVEAFIKMTAARYDELRSREVAMASSDNRHKQWQQHVVCVDPTHQWQQHVVCVDPTQEWQQHVVCESGSQSRWGHYP